MHAGRHTAQLSGPFVVFLIGLRINRWRAVRRWWPVAQAMGPMLRQLHAQPELGLLHAQSYLSWRGVTMVQYWRSFEHLERFARDPALAHQGPWAAFNRARKASANGNAAVGIWHETYQVADGAHESIYVNTPRMGLALAGEHLPVGAARDRARQRMG